MAIRKSIRPARQSDRAGTNRPRTPVLDCASGAAISGASLSIVPAEQASDVVRGLVMVALRLKVIY
jgi:hypothetical protein